MLRSAGVSVEKLPKSSLGQEFLVESGEFLGPHQIYYRVGVLFLIALLCCFLDGPGLWVKQIFKKFDHVRVKFLISKILNTVAAIMHQ